MIGGAKPERFGSIAMVRDQADQGRNSFIAHWLQSLSYPKLQGFFRLSGGTPNESSYERAEFDSPSRHTGNTFTQLLHPKSRGLTCRDNCTPLARVVQNT